MQNEVSFGRALKLFWSNYVKFKGRSRRSEYWFATLQNFIFLSPAIIGVFIGFSIIGVGSAYNNEAILGLGGLIFIFAGIYMFIYALATFIPNLALATRRLHDRNMSTTIAVISIVMGFLLGLLSTIFNLTEPIIAVLYFIVYFISLGLSIIMLVISCLDNKKETNKYGPSPKYSEHDIDFQGENHNPVSKLKKR